MLRSGLEHLIRASAEIAGDDEIIINENTNGVTGYCLAVHDLAISKLIAQRPKDLEFVQELVRHDMIQKKTMLHRLGQTDLQDSIRSNTGTRIESSFME